MGLFSDLRAGGRPFDRVELKEVNGPTRKLTPDEFDKLALDVRVKAIFEKRLRFFKGTEEIPLKKAMDM